MFFQDYYFLFDIFNSLWIPEVCISCIRICSWRLNQSQRCWSMGPSSKNYWVYIQHWHQWLVIRTNWSIWALVLEILHISRRGIWTSWMFNNTAYTDTCTWRYQTILISRQLLVLPVWKGCGAICQTNQQQKRDWKDICKKREPTRIC